MKMGKGKEAYFRLLLYIGSILPIFIFRPIVKSILRKRSKTKMGYEESCNRLIDFGNESMEIIRIPSKYWRKNPIVKAHSLGLKFKLDLRDNSQRCLYFNGVYEPETLEFICSIIEKNNVFVDIGAHIGIHALVAAKELKIAGGGKVIAFEPTTDSFSSLQYNCLLNNLTIDAYNIAMGDKNERTEIFGDRKWGKHDAAVRSLFGDGEMVQNIYMDTFDNWIIDKNIHQIDIVKMDVEGAEYKVLKGMQNTLKTMKPPYLIIEIKQSLLLKASIEIDDIFEFLDDLSYVNSKIIEDNYIFKNLSYDQQ
jgi:FkbM family methyltransferase